MEHTTYNNRLTVHASWGKVVDACDCDGFGFEKVRELLKEGRMAWLLDQYKIRFAEKVEDRDPVRKNDRTYGLKGFTDYVYKDEKKGTVRKEQVFGSIWRWEHDGKWVLRVPCTRKFAKSFVHNAGSQRSFCIHNTYRKGQEKDIAVFLMGAKFTALKNRYNRGQGDNINAPGYCEVYSADPELVQSVC